MERGQEDIKVDQKDMEKDQRPMRKDQEDIKEDQKDMEDDQGAMRKDQEGIKRGQKAKRRVQKDREEDQKPTTKDSEVESDSEAVVPKKSSMKSKSAEEDVPLDHREHSDKPRRTKHRHGGKKKRPKKLSSAGHTSISFDSSLDTDYAMRTSLPKDMASYFETRYEFLNRQHLLSGKKRQLSTWMASILYLCNYMTHFPFYGAYCMAKAGYVPAVAAAIGLWLLSITTQHLLLLAIKRVQTVRGGTVRFDFGELVKFYLMNGRRKALRKFANIAKKITDLAMVVYLLSHGSYIFQTCTGTLDDLMMLFNASHNKYKLRSMLFTPLWLISLLGDLKLLFPLQLLGLIFNCFAMLFSTRYIFLLKKHLKTTPRIAAFNEKSIDYLQFYTHFLLSCNGDVFLPYLRNEMMYPEHLDRKFGIINIGMLIYFVIMAAMSCLSYLHYGIYVEKFLVKSFIKETEARQFVYIISILICLVSFILFPLVLYVPNNIILPLVFLHVRNPRGQLIMELVTKSALILSVASIVILKKQKIHIDEMVATTFDMFMIAFLPAFLCHLSQNPLTTPKSRKIFGYVMMGIGCTGIITGFVGAVVRVKEL